MSELLTKEDGESNGEYFARLKEHQDSINAKHTHEVKQVPPKTCGKCGHKNSGASKTCRGVDSDEKRCGQILKRSQTASALRSVKRRKKLREKAKNASHNTCNICKRKLSKSQDLGISLCFKNVVGTSGRTNRRVEPCGRAMHLKCLRQQYNKSNERQGDFGICQNKCANCNRATKYPHFVQIHIPRD